MYWLRCLCFWLKDERDEKLESDEHCLHLDNLNLGIDVAGGQMHVFIPENTKYPIKVEKLFTTMGDHQSISSTKVCEGSSSLCLNNVVLGDLSLEGIPPAPNGVAMIKVCFEMDANGTLTVSAVDMISCKLMKEITITSEQRRSAKIVNAKYRLQIYANNIMKTLSDVRYEGKVKAADKEKVMNMADETIEWLNRYEWYRLYEYEDTKKDLEVLWNPIITKLYQNAVGTSSSVLKVELESTSPKADSMLHEVH